ncbi:MAG: hypothetical protein ABH828_01625 [archaeon]
MYKKGQAAMEFLMTYGWAILVVMAAIGALAYFGVLDTAGFLPERCSFPAGLDCIGEAAVDATGDTLTFVVQNSKGEDIVINATGSSLTTTDCTAGAITFFDGIGGTPAAGYVELANNDKATVQIACATLDNGRFKGDVVLAYTLESTGLTLESAGNIRGKAS